MGWVVFENLKSLESDGLSLGFRRMRRQRFYFHLSDALWLALKN
jgi:hypothetical protein